MATDKWYTLGQRRERAHWRILSEIAMALSPPKAIVLGNNSHREVEAIARGLPAPPERASTGRKERAMIVFYTTTGKSWYAGETVRRADRMRRRAKRLNMRCFHPPWHEAIREMVAPAEGVQEGWMPFIAGAVFVFADDGPRKTFKRLELIKPLMGANTLVVVPRSHEDAQGAFVREMERKGYFGIAMGAVTVMRPKPTHEGDGE